MKIIQINALALRSTFLSRDTKEGLLIVSTMKKAVCVAKTLGTCLSVFYEYRPDQCLHGIKFAIQVSSYTHNGSKDVKLVETDKKNMMNILISSLSPALIRLVYVNIINLAFCLLMTYYSAFKHIYAQFINIFIPQFQICSMNLFF